MKKELGSLRSWGFLMGGNLLYALALALFLTGNNIAAGGLAGIAVVLCSFLPLGVGMLTLVMNIPILASAVVIKGWRYTIGTIVAAFLYSFKVEILDRMMPTLTNEPLVAAIFGGVLYGIGMTLLTVGNVSVGGTDLLCRLLNEKIPSLSVARLSLFIDGGIVVLAMLVFGNVEVGLYAIVTIFVCSTVADRVLLGIGRGSICLVVSGKDAKEIANPLMEKLGRAVTRWDSNGMYTGEERNVLMVAVRPREVFQVKTLLKELDPSAFVVVVPANELIGGHFSGRKIT